MEEVGDLCVLMSRATLNDLNPLVRELAAALAATPPPLDAAWAEAEAAVLEWGKDDKFAALSLFSHLDRNGSSADAERIEHREPNSGPATSHSREADGSTPVEALQRLAAILAAILAGDHKTGEPDTQPAASGEGETP